jgi:hypothetical protein
MLFDMTDFQGWKAGARCEDPRFAIRRLAVVERLAMAGEKT